MNYSLQMNKTNIIGPLPVAQPRKPMQPSAHSATSRDKWAVAFKAEPLRHCFAMPPPLPRGGLGIPQSFASSPEAPLLGELAGASPTERLDGRRTARRSISLPVIEVINFHSTPFYHTFPLATRLNGRKNSQNGQKSRKNACKALCRRPSEPKNTGEKTPESPKIPLQLGCSVTQIRHFFKRTFFNLPLIFENNVKKATDWLHTAHKKTAKKTLRRKKRLLPDSNRRHPD